MENNLKNENKILVIAELPMEIEENYWNYLKKNLNNDVLKKMQEEIVKSQPKPYKSDLSQENK
jgi:hypothetical protein